MRELEAEIRTAFDRGDLARAATLAIDGYGAEVLGWMVTTTGDLGLAEEAFSQAAQDLWTSLSSFRWECSMRTWLYTLARNALAKLRRNHARQERVSNPVADIAETTRSRTRPWLRTEVKERFRRIRESLDEESRELLVLRVDRQMKWADIVMVLKEPGPPEQAAARIRKRFSLLKSKLRKHAEQEGLLARSD